MVVFHITLVAKSHDPSNQNPLEIPCTNRTVKEA